MKRIVPLLESYIPDVVKPFTMLGSWDDMWARLTFSSGVTMQFKDKVLGKTLAKKAEYHLLKAGYKDAENLEVIEIMSIKTPEDKQNKGLGSKAMEEVVSVADKNKTILYLEAIPIGNKPVSAISLTNWYSRFGFILIMGGAIPKMLRTPK